MLKDREQASGGKKTPHSILLDWVSGRILSHDQAEEIPAEGILTRRLEDQ